MYPYTEGRCHSRPGGFGRRLLPTLRKRCFLSLSFMEIAVLFSFIAFVQFYRNLRTPLSLRGLLPPRLLAFLGIVLLLLLLLGSDLVIEVLLLLLLDAR